MQLWNGVCVFSAAIALSVAALSQTTPTTPATCTTPPATVTAFDIERKPSLSGFLTTQAISVPPEFLAALTSGAVELREKMIYNSQLGTITFTVFAVPGGTPIPTPNFDFRTGVAQTATMKVNEIITGCSPFPSITFIGKIIDSAPNPSLYGVGLTGATSIVSVGYTLDTPPKINNVAGTIAGLAVAWSADAVGTLTFPPPPAGPPTPGTGVSITLKHPGGTAAASSATPVQVAQSPILLDASASTGQGALTFTWASGSASPVSFVSTGTTGQILVYFPSSGDYAITVTVTDSTGASANLTTIFQFTGRPN